MSQLILREIHWRLSLQALYLMSQQEESCFVLSLVMTPQGTTELKGGETP
jgi:hypothetical protein